jgi:hypothetical protein
MTIEDIQDKIRKNVQVSFPPAVVVITAYEPDPEEWIAWKVRR